MENAAITPCIEIGWIASPGAAPGAAPDPALHGEKAAFLDLAHRAGLAVPPGFVLPPGYDVGRGDGIDAALAALESASGRRLGDPHDPLLVSVRPAAALPAGGIAPAILDIGVTSATLPGLAARHGARTAHDLHRRLIQAYGSTVLGIDGEEFEYALQDALRRAGCASEDELDAAALAALAGTFLGLIADAGTGPFPDDARAQLDGALGGLPALWNDRRAEARRRALGAAATPLGIIVQEMALGIGPGACGAGLAVLRDEATGEPCLAGRWLAQAQGDDTLTGPRPPQAITDSGCAAPGFGGPSLEAAAPDAVAGLRRAGALLEAAIGDAVALEFTVAAGRLHVLEVMRARRTTRAAVRIAVDLAEAGAIDRETALMRIDPARVEEQLHPAIDPAAPRDPVGAGLAASPGAASGPLVFSPGAAERAAQRNQPAILALVEAGPEDIRGMHAARGVLTVRGGMTSHAAVVARGLGKPCVVGAYLFTLDRAAGALRTPDGRVFREGDPVTVDGTTGQVLAGSVAMVQPEATGAFATLLAWADETRRMGVRANADTVRDARTADGFDAEGIGLCRTEHMFFQPGRIIAMREMILAETEEERRTALARLMPMQRADFRTLFATMPGRPVTVRLLDPPLHEFLPHGEAEMRETADSLGLPVARVVARAADLAEFNPMLGKRGCRIGIAYPEIYEMQARAIFEAALDAGETTGSPVRPEIMIPLVSAVRELEVLSEAIEGVARAVRAERGAMVDFTVGVMVETPRACLRADEMAAHAGFLSFGTNDLTQMLYGLSRDDAGRFMLDYVSRRVFPHDPFDTLDMEGVGEIMKVAIERARARRPRISIGICGEHGGDPRSIGFFEKMGVDYVSCSPFRVPVARLAAAQAAIRARGGAPATGPAPRGDDEAAPPPS